MKTTTLRINVTRDEISAAARFLESQAIGTLQGDGRKTLEVLSRLVCIATFDRSLTSDAAKSHFANSYNSFRKEWNLRHPDLVPASSSSLTH